MTILHGLWTGDRFHIFAEAEGASEMSGRTDVRGDAPAEHPFAFDEAELRDIAGDAVDSLLVMGAESCEIVLRLPASDGRALPSTMAGRPPAASGRGSIDPAEGADDATSVVPASVTLEACRVPTLAFSPGDAMDILSGIRAADHRVARMGADFEFWVRVARFVLRLLASEQFVPDLYTDARGVMRAAWRAIAGEAGTRAWIERAIGTMPPVCRSFVPAAGGELSPHTGPPAPGRESGTSVEGVCLAADASAAPPLDAADLVESFLWRTVDASVRRCLDDEELVDAILAQTGDRAPAQTQWLAALVRADRTAVPVHGEAAAVLAERVHSWIARLDIDPAFHECRTCFCLHPPPDTSEGSRDEREDWKLTVHVQSVQNPELVIDAHQATQPGRHGPAVLGRPFQDAARLVREDLPRAARHFSPIERCIESAGRHPLKLTRAEAHAFLRHAAPVLELEGFGVWKPVWWTAREAGIGLRLDLRPSRSVGEELPRGIGLDALVDFQWSVACGEETLSSEELERLAQLSVPLVRLRGRWMELDSASLKQAVEFVREHEHGQATVFDILRRANMPGAADAGLPVVSVQADGWVDRLLSGGQNVRYTEVAPPERLHGVLRPYQLNGLSWLEFLDQHGLGACLADDMGLGKTVQLLCLLLHERRNGERPGPTLIIVPMSVVGNWQREVERFAPSLRVMVHHGVERLSGRAFVEQVGEYDIVVSTYGLAFRDYDHLGAVRWHRVVLDEAQNIKNPAAKQARAVRTLQTSRRVALTGTPIENRLTELWSIMDFLNPNLLGPATEFRRRFAVPIERHKDSEQSRRLRRLIHPFILRRVKTDPDIISDLPEKMEMNVYCNLTREQAGLYQAVTSEMLGSIDGADGIQRRGLILAAIVKLKQICNHPAQFLGEEGPLPERSGKCDRLREMLEEVVAEGDFALVFTQFREMGKRLQELLQRTLDREILFLHGGTPNHMRTELVERFQARRDETPVFILSLKAGGVGLNLTAANHVFHFDRWWNPAVEQQATDRAYRIGQTRRIQVHKFICVGTLEERIDAMLEAKRDLAENIIGSGEHWLTELSTDKLRSLFTLSDDAVAD